MLKLLKRLTVKQWLMFAVAVAFIIASVWLDLRIPEFTEEILAIAKNETGEYSFNQIWAVGGLMMLCTLASMACVVIIGYITAVISAGFAENVRRDLFAHVNNFSMAEMKQFSIPSLITRSTNDITQVRMFIAMGAQMLIRSPIMAIWAIAKITSRSWELSTATAVTIIALVTVITLLIIIVFPKYRKIQKLTDDVNQIARENLTGVRVVRAYNAEEFEAGRFEKANDKLTKNNLFTFRAMAIMSPFMNLLMAGLGLAIWWIASYLITHNQIPPAEIGSFFNSVPVFMSYSVQIIMSFMMLIMIFIMLPRAAISAKRVQEVFSTNTSIVEGSKSSQDLTSDVALEFRNVSFKYPDAEGYVIKDVNLTVRKGQTVAFIGSTGSGKSTLINLVPRIYDATEGEILLNGTNIKEYTLDAINDVVGYVPQKAVLFKGTIASNVAFGTVRGEPICPGGDDEIWKALDVAQASEFVKKMPDQLQSDVSQSGKNLSGGQKQRIAIARVVARKPEIFIFDDTFSALDYKTDRNLRTALNTATKDAIKLIVAQRIGTIKEANIIVVLDSGKVVGMGTHKELLKNCDVYKEIAYSQLSKEELK